MKGGAENVTFLKGGFNTKWKSPANFEAPSHSDYSLVWKVAQERQNSKKLLFHLCCCSFIAVVMRWGLATLSHKHAIAAPSVQNCPHFLTKKISFWFFLFSYFRWVSRQAPRSQALRIWSSLFIPFSYLFNTYWYTKTTKVLSWIVKSIVSSWKWKRISITSHQKGYIFMAGFLERFLPMKPIAVTSASLSVDIFLGQRRIWPWSSAFWQLPWRSIFYMRLY